MFKDHGSPAKRASELLLHLEEEKLVEGMRMGDMRKAWRLSRQGRSEAECTKRPVPFNTTKIRHWLTIGDCYIAMKEAGKLHFETELHIEYEPKKFFSPDVFFIFGGRAYLMEVQLKRMSGKEWAQKWKRWNDYFNAGHFKTAPWQRFKKDGGLIPHMVVLTPQPKETVGHGFEVKGRELLLLKEPPELLSVK
jgi:hypothetical protein